MAVSDYFSLLKPRLAAVNVLAAAAGFCVGPVLSWSSFMYMVVGLFLVIGSGCTLNNLYDRGIDAKMTRTRERALVVGRVSTAGASVLALVLLVLGSLLLYQTTALALLAALVGFVSYVFLYTPLKHKSSIALFVGAVAGATPPVVGYAAAGGDADLIMLALFVALYVWQLPHFIAIATYRFAEYHAAGVPLVIKKEHSPRVQKVARGVFHGSLLVLTLACAALIARALL